MKINGYYVVTLILGMSAINFAIFNVFSNNDEPAYSSLSEDPPPPAYFSGRESRAAYSSLSEDPPPSDWNGPPSPAASQTIRPLIALRPLQPAPATQYVTRAHMEKFARQADDRICRCIKQCLRPKSLELSD